MLLVFRHVIFLNTMKDEGIMIILIKQDVKTKEYDRTKIY